MKRDYLNYKSWKRRLRISNTFLLILISSIAFLLIKIASKQVDIIEFILITTIISIMIFVSFFLTMKPEDKESYIKYVSRFKYKKSIKEEKQKLKDNHKKILDRKFKEVDYK